MELGAPPPYPGPQGDGMVFHHEHQGSVTTSYPESQGQQTVNCQQAVTQGAMVVYHPALEQVVMLQPQPRLPGV